MKIILYNDFHNTEVNVVVPFNGVLTKSQMRRVQKKLCGRKNCACGPVRGDKNPDFAYTSATDYNSRSEYESIQIFEFPEK